jgi:Arc/MetJ family transcription regulator
MRVDILLDDMLVAKAQDYTGLNDAPSLLHEALTALVERESARRLVSLGGIEPDITARHRRRPE